MIEGVGEAGMRSASTSPTEVDVRCDKERSSASEERRWRGSTAAVADAEGPLIFSARPGESGSSTCGGVLAGDDWAFIWEKPRSSSSSTPDWQSLKRYKSPLFSNESHKVPRGTHHRRRKQVEDPGPIPVFQAMAFFRQVSE